MRRRETGCTLRVSRVARSTRLYAISYLLWIAGTAENQRKSSCARGVKGTQKYWMLPLKKE